MANPLRILADANIPLAAEAFQEFGEVRQLPGHAITSDELSDVDVLLVRSVTLVNEALLAGSPVRFVGTATAGTDHVDEAYLTSAEIGFASAPGSNASAVVEYTLAALLSIAADMSVGLRGKKLGVVGCGTIGGEVARRAEAFGIDVLRCDPPLHDKHPKPSPFVALDEVLARCDFITIHTPLTHDGAYPTHHLFGLAAFQLMKPEAVLINTARGAVVHNAALRLALQTGAIAGAVLDVWEEEPEIDANLARLVRIATPHIAGYSLDGKLEGTRMLEVAFREWLVVHGELPPPVWDFEEALQRMDAKDLNIHALPVQANLDDLNEVRWLNVLVRQAYSIRKDDAVFRQAVLSARPGEQGRAFRELRRTYPERRTWDRIAVKTVIPGWLESVVTDGLGMSLTL